jgi:hypothetical protein
MEGRLAFHGSSNESSLGSAAIADPPRTSRSSSKPARPCPPSPSSNSSSGDSQLFENTQKRFGLALSRRRPDRRCQGWRSAGRLAPGPKHRAMPCCRRTTARPGGGPRRSAGSRAVRFGVDGPCRRDGHRSVVRRSHATSWPSGGYDGSGPGRGVAAAAGCAAGRVGASRHRLSGTSQAPDSPPAAR